MKKEIEITFDEFRTVVDRYGCEPKRWPVELRSALTAFAKDHPGARDVLNEHRAFEQLLENNAAPGLETAPNPSDLANRIVQAAMSDAALKTQSGSKQRAADEAVVDLGAYRAHQRTSTRLPTWRLNQTVLASGALAASLVLGVFAGWHGFAGSALSPVSDALVVSVFNDANGDNLDPLFDLVEANGFGDEIL